MFGDELKKFLLARFPDAREVSGGREVAMRCRFCGDSQKDNNARHLYISVADNVPMYNCFHCPAHGMLTDEVLKMMLPDFTTTDIEMFTALKNNNRTKLKTIRMIMNKNHTYNIFNTYISDNQMSKIKLQYINKRLGLNLTYRDLLEDKIVLNLWDLLDSNHITEYTRYEKTIDELNKYSIGFLSMDNSYVTMKNLNYGKSSKYLNNRYNNYSIFKNPVQSKKIYLIPTQVNLASIISIKVHIAEGQFDILSIFYNLRGGDRRNNIYAAICGKSYSVVMEMFIREFGLMNIEFHIYIDNDIKQSELDGVKRICKDFEIDTYIHRNTYIGEKDFGVDLQHIKESISPA